MVDVMPGTPVYRGMTIPWSVAEAVLADLSAF
jgi:hypothetical protein